MSGIIGSRFNMRGSGLVGSLGTDGQVFTSSGAGAGAVFEAASGGVNTPAVLAVQSTAQSIANDTYVKTLFQTEIFDTDSMFASSTFTPTTAGKYQIISQTFLDGTSADGGHAHYTAIYFNGSILSEAAYSFWSTPIVNQIIEFNGSSDYVEIYFKQSSGTTRDSAFSRRRTYFQAIKIIE